MKIARERGRLRGKDKNTELQKGQGRQGGKNKGREKEGECMGNVRKRRGRETINGMSTDKEGKENLGK